VVAADVVAADVVTPADAAEGAVATKNISK